MNISVPGEAERGIPSDLKAVAALSVTLLIVSESEQPHIVTHSVLTRLNWRIRSAFSFEQANDMLNQQEFGVVLCDCDFSRGSWKALLQEPHICRRPPRVLVFCRHADVPLWGEVLNLGAWDLLMYPFEMRELIRSTALAWQSWAREGQRSNPAVARREQVSATGSNSTAAQVETRARRKAAGF